MKYVKRTIKWLKNNKEKKTEDIDKMLEGVDHSKMGVNLTKERDDDYMRLYYYRLAYLEAKIDKEHRDGFKELPDEYEEIQGKIVLGFGLPEEKRPKLKFFKKDYELFNKETIDNE